jgi:hypothetical protein
MSPGSHEASEISCPLVRANWGMRPSSGRSSVSLATSVGPPIAWFCHGHRTSWQATCEDSRTAKTSAQGSSSVHRPRRALRSNRRYPPRPERSTVKSPAPPRVWGVLPGIAYLDVRPVISMMRVEFSTANRWQLRSVASYALGVRLLLPLALGGVVVGLASTPIPWTFAFFVPTLWCFIVGTLLGFPGALIGGGPDFFTQRALFLGGKYALRRLHPQNHA